MLVMGIVGGRVNFTEKPRPYGHGN